MKKNQKRKTAGKIPAIKTTSIKSFAEKAKITNFITNAIKYSPGADMVSVTSTSDKKTVTVCVQDYGIGISDEIQEKIFDRFYRFHDGVGHTYPGLGLGLYIASEIIKHHNGKINVKSEINAGSTFCFTIPIDPFAVKL